MHGRKLALVGLAALAGCGGSSTSSSSSGSTASSSGGSGGGPPEACSVLTEKMAQGFIGAQAKRTRKAQPNPHETQCVYTNTKDAHGGAVSILVGDWSFIKLSATGSTKKVSGIGDEALASGTDLVARKGDLGVEISAFKNAGEFSGAAATKEDAKALKLEEQVAKAVLEKL